MKIIKQISIILVLIVCLSCKNSSSNPDDNQGGRPKYGGRPTNNQDTASIPDTDESGPMYGDKEIEWADGNTYTYDYTEQIAGGRHGHRRTPTHALTPDPGAPDTGT